MTPLEAMGGGINRESLGALLEGMRKAAGYSRAVDFAAAIEETAGIPCKKDLVYRIEAGKQEPSITYLCAVSLTLFGKVLHWDVIQAITKSACPSWKEYEEAIRRRKNREYMLELRERGINAAMRPNGEVYDKDHPDDIIF